MCSHTFTLFWLRKMSVTVEIFQLSLRVPFLRRSLQFKNLIYLWWLQEIIITQVLACPINHLHDYDYIVLNNTNRFFLYFLFSPWNIKNFCIMFCRNQVNYLSRIKGKISPFLLNVSFRDCDLYFISRGSLVFTLIVPDAITCPEFRFSAFITWLQ